MWESEATLGHHIIRSGSQGTPFRRHIGMCRQERDSSGGLTLPHRYLNSRYRIKLQNLSRSLLPPQR